MGVANCRLKSGIQAAGREEAFVGAFFDQPAAV
jgi:hypothetical protein